MTRIERGPRSLLDDIQAVARQAPKKPKLEDLAEGEFFLYQGHLWAVIKPASYLMTLVRQITDGERYVNRGTEIINKNTEVTRYPIRG